jgi:putative component of membrane protein insertase Oxa1/YidC/SpoIIIJ protein YidD
VLMGVWRVMRCNPFSKGGWDPVDPEDRPRYLGDGEAARPRADARAAEAGHTTD